MKYKNYIINTFRHFKKVCTHKHWVFYYCCKVGIPFQGLVHDLSKFSPTEFWESVKYYQGTSSPIDACKKENGWSAAWNMTREDYINMKMQEAKEDAEDVLNNYLKPFDMVVAMYYPNNMTKEEFDEFLEETGYDKEHENLVGGSV